MLEEALNLSIRSASPDEASFLSDLALRSKAHWGYAKEFLEACRAELTITPDYIATSPVFVLEEGKRVVGFYGLRERENKIELVYLFVEPFAMNRGYGKLLWKHLVETAAKLTPKRISIESDPYAESFYKRMGARGVGFVSSSVQADRKLPLLEFHLS